MFDQAHHELDAGADVGLFEQLLFLRQLQGQVGDDRVDEPAGILDAGNRGHHFRRNLLAQLQILIELRQQRAHEQLRFLFRHLFGRENSAFGPVVVAFEQHFRQARALQTLNEQLDRTVRQPHQLENRGYRAHFEQVFHAGIVFRRIPLRNKQNLLVVGHRHFEAALRTRTAHEQRLHDLRVDDHVPQWEQRQPGNFFVCVGFSHNECRGIRNRTSREPATPPWKFRFA